MALIACLLIGLGFFLVGQRLFWRFSLYPPLDSLRHGRVHYLLFGIVFGIAIPDAISIFGPFNDLRHGLMWGSLIWFGLQTGLGLDLLRLRQFSPSALSAHLATIALTALFAGLAVFASGAVLHTQFGLLADRPLAALLIAGFATTVRFPEPAFQWRRGTPADPASSLPIANIFALLLIGIGAPLFSTFFSTASDPLSSLGLTRTLSLIVGTGIAGGMALDFVLRAHRRFMRGSAMALGIVITLGGLCQTLALPALPVGLFAGIWLVNASVTKREVQLFSLRASNVIEPLFFFLFGTAIGGYGGGGFFLTYPLILFALTVLIVRTMGCTLGLAVSHYLWAIPKSWQEIQALSLRPMGTLSAAIGVQALYLLNLEHNTLVAGLVFAVLLTQTAILPPGTPSNSAVSTQAET